ncbi:MAG: alginate lyase family protein [Desulfuromonadaceae bacterium]
MSRLLKSFRFYLTRFKRASLAELIHRVGQAGTHYRAGFRAGRGRLPCRIPTADLQNIGALIMPAFTGCVESAEIERILAGFRFTLNFDPDALVHYERELRHSYCASTRSIIGTQVDIRALWEPARLQHVTLLIARLQQHPDAPDNTWIKSFARNEIMQWLEDNPFLRGPHYLSAMECGLRVPVFLYALKSLDNLTNGDAERILTAVFLHAWWIEKNLSLFSSLGNHTVCEAMGLVIAGGIHRQTDAGQRWLNTGITLLKQELPHQILTDGGPAEQSFGYHRLVLDIYCLAINFLENNGLKNCADFKGRLLLGEEFLASFRVLSGHYPAPGDYDDGYAIAPGLSPQRLIPADKRSACQTFATSGYSIIRGSSDTLLTFDHGPLGMAPLFNHGHADALSVTLSVGGIPFLVDSGTYRYNGSAMFRRYFKGTRAHNTVTIDGVDQATQLTSFVWGNPYNCQLEQAVETAGGLLVEASHDGYARLKNRVRHIRSILNAPDGTWQITDHFQGSGQHCFELNFHLHPEVTLSEVDGGWLAERNGHRIRFELESGRFQLRQGEDEPPLGWFSQGYNQKVQSPLLQAVRNGSPTEMAFITRIAPCGVTKN